MKCLDLFSKKKVSKHTIPIFINNSESYAKICQWKRGEQKRPRSACASAVRLGSKLCINIFFISNDILCKHKVCLDVQVDLCSFCLPFGSVGV